MWGWQWVIWHRGDRKWKADEDPMYDNSSRRRNRWRDLKIMKSEKILIMNYLELIKMTKILKFKTHKVLVELSKMDTPSAPKPHTKIHCSQTAEHQRHFKYSRKERREQPSDWEQMSLNQQEAWGK